MEDIKQLADIYDFRGLAKAFQEGDLDWHEQEWKEFIGHIKNKTLNEAISRVQAQNLNQQRQYYAEGEKYTLKYEETMRIRRAMADLTEIIIQSLESMKSEEGK